MADRSRIDAAITQFQIATLGEDVRDALVEVADSCGYAIENQLIALDNTVSRSGMAPDALATKTAIEAESQRAIAEEARLETLFTEPVDDAVNNWLDDHPEATTTVTDGSITKAKLNSEVIDFISGKRPILNVADFFPGELTSNNLDLAIAAALECGSRIYIPAGVYVVNLVIETDCDIYLDRDCYLVPNGGYPALWAKYCSISIHGGNVYAGQNNPNNRTKINTGAHAIIELSGCKNCVIEDLKCSHSKFYQVIGIYGKQDHPEYVAGLENEYPNPDNEDEFLEPCEHITVRNCTFENVLMSAIHILYFCRDINVCHNTFRNSISYQEKLYCYFVYTGARSLSDMFYPPDGLIYEGNYLENSEDCALDTHGANNVIIRNNTIINCGNSITAYNDARRVRRPRYAQDDPTYTDLGPEHTWKMRNVLIENNYVETTKSESEEEGYDWPHPPLFVGGANSHGNERYSIVVNSHLTLFYTNNPGFPDEFSNAVIRNNYLKSPTKITSGIIAITVSSVNVAIENNIIDCCGVARPGSFPGCVYNVQFIRNHIKNADHSKSLYFGIAATGVVKDNYGDQFRMSYSPDAIVCIEGDYGDMPHSIVSPSAVKPGMITRRSVSEIDGIYIAKHLRGIRMSNAWDGEVSESRAAIRDFRISVDGETGIATILDDKQNRYVPGQCLAVSSQGVSKGTQYISEMIDYSSFKITNADGSISLESGEYDVTLGIANFAKLS